MANILAYIGFAIFYLLGCFALARIAGRLIPKKDKEAMEMAVTFAAIVWPIFLVLSPLFLLFYFLEKTFREAA